jgi:hypothetical protein
MSDHSALNTGVILHRVSETKGRGNAKRTIVVTGVARSGTSLVASVLRAAGMHMGDTVYDVVNEDAHMLEIVRSRDAALLRTLIKQRNAKHASWGFKIPNLHVYLRHDELNLFRNPHLIVICRDPVAVAMRNALSEHTGPLHGLMAAAGAMQAMAHFADRATCPLLLLSYEKVVAYPTLLIDSVLDFCGIRVDDADRTALLEQIKPNNPDYLTVATRRFLGRIEGIQNGELYGWCYEENRLEPVRLELWADDRLLESVTADRYRADLIAGGIGNGCHGFSIDLSRHKLPADTAIRVKIAGRLLDLENSGRRLDYLDAMVGAE